VKITEINLFTPLSKSWLSLTQFSSNSLSLENFYKKNSNTEFHKNPTKRAASDTKSQVTDRLTAAGQM
jgi:hypothetical protein